MFNIGTPELLLLLLLAFVVFGPKHLPTLARKAGKLVGEWRKLTRDLEKTIRDESEPDRPGAPDARPEPSRGRRRTSHETQPRLPG